MRSRSPRLDFGWRLRGQVISVLPDRSTDLSNPSRLQSFLDHYCADVDTLQACLQCGACTATCDLAGEGSLFPWRQVTFVRYGLEARLVADPAIWHCYGCGDCSTRCPSEAKPGRIMAALRHVAIERFAFPRCLPPLINDPRLFWTAYGAAAVVLAAVILAVGAFRPAEPQVRYAAMLAHEPLNLLFGGAAVLALLAMTLGVRAAWRAFGRASENRPGRAPVTAAIGRALVDLLRRRQLSGCGARRARSLAHQAVSFGFAGLLAVSAFAAGAILTNREFPLGFGHPVKVAANVFAVMLLAGATYGLIARIAGSAGGERSSFFDWVFLVNLVLIGASGMALEALRAWNLETAYSVYFAHLVLALVFLATLPYTKLAHAVYRFTALVERQRASPPPAAGGRTAGKIAAGPSRPKRLAPEPASEAPIGPPERLVEMDQTALAGHSDATLAAVYYQLRDQSEPRGEHRYYPNIQRLFCTPIEREKDRREARAIAGQPEKAEVQAWYEDAAKRSCAWWLENHLVARRSLQSCMSCGLCSSVCPAVQYYDEYNPRCLVDTALSGDEERLVALLRSEALWLCGQCGSCKARCPRENSIMGLVSSLRCLAQIKGYHTSSVRGRQQYAARHWWGANFWNRACSLYFRNADAASHPDFGPRHARYVAEQEEQHLRLGGHPDSDGHFGGRKVDPATLRELRRCVQIGGTLFLWNRLEEHAQSQAAALGLGIDEYFEMVRTEG